jgi:hypothetical protein
LAGVQLQNLFAGVALFHCACSSCPLLLLLLLLLLQVVLLQCADYTAAGAAGL